VLLVSNYYPEHVGGIETVAHNLAGRYRRAGHRVRWCAAEPASLPHRGSDDDVPLRAWNGTERGLGFPYPVPTPGAWRRLRREVSACDVLHVHDCLYAASAFACLYARRSGKPVLLTQHIGLVPYRAPALRWAQRAALLTLGRATLAAATRVTFVSPQVRAFFERLHHFREETEVIENGVDSDLFQPDEGRDRARRRGELGLRAERPLLLFVGRFVEKKGLHLLRQAIAANPAWNWLLIGRAGSEDPTAWRLDNLSVLPPQEPQSLASYYRAADLLVLPSTGEGFPVVVQEAMACGTPALVSEETAAVIPAARPYLFAAERSSAAIVARTSAALKALEAAPDVRREVARFARERWSWSVVGARYEALLNQLAGERRRALARTA
jgi:glycosyltransferase involved in cell wall biosynthesis